MFDQKKIDVIVPPGPYPKCDCGGTLLPKVEPAADKVTHQMHDPVFTILREIENPNLLQRDIAMTYAVLIRQNAKRGEDSSLVDWPLINEAIMRRWKGKAALAHVKRMAWELVKEAGVNHARPKEGR